MIYFFNCPALLHKEFEMPIHLSEHDPIGKSKNRTRGPLKKKVCVFLF